MHKHVGYWLRCLLQIWFQASFAELKLAAKDISVAQWVVLRTLYDKRDGALNEAAEERWGWTKVRSLAWWSGWSRKGS